MRLCVTQKAREAGVDYVWAAVFATLHILFIWPWWEMVTLSARTHPLCVYVLLFCFVFSQVDSVTSMLRGAVVARAFEQTKSFTPARGLQGKNPII